MPDAGVDDRAQDLRRLVAGARERLGADHALAGGRRGADRREMRLVGERDDDEVDVRVRAELLHGGVLGGDAPAATEVGGSTGVAGVVRDELRGPDVAQRVGVRVADEAGAEEADAGLAGHGASFRRDGRASRSCRTTP
ncbi:hypothetical protein GCM10025864_12730 [Luteimicrobium album]|uniref:Uncharacterized protein n=1 Tax=Luteimicrobium album TaxID=1054550 RepID=A0ABQ6HYD7_9MICO|nr:hypothetical protein GCM10025864_12730 [Luteimicrobium album]